MKIYEKKKDSSIQISQIQKLTKFTSYELLPLPFLQVTTSNPPFFGPSNFNLSPIIETFDRVTYTENRWNKQQFRGKLTLLLARSMQLVSGRCTTRFSITAPSAQYISFVGLALPTELQPNHVQRNYDRSNSSSFFLPLVFTFWIEKYGDGDRDEED